MDVLTPRQDGVEACREFMEKLPATQVLILTALTETDAVIEAGPPERRATCSSTPAARSWRRLFGPSPKAD